MNLDQREDRSVACAEFVLGTLTDAERQTFLARLAADHELSREVGFWQDRLLGLVRQVSPVEPSSQLWDRIEAALPAAEAREAPAAAARPKAPLPGRAMPWWQRLGFWQGLSGIAVAATILLASLLVLRPPAAPEVAYVAVLQGPDQRAGWIVQAAQGVPAKLVPLSVPGQVPQGKSWQLWTKAKTAAAPTSLGLVAGPAQMQVPWDRLPELGDEQLFEITLEPEGGSPTGRPTGPVLFIGKAQRV